MCILAYPESSRKFGTLEVIASLMFVILFGYEIYQYQTIARLLNYAEHVKCIKL